MFISRDAILFMIFSICALIQLLNNLSKRLDNGYKIVPILSINKEVELPIVSLCLSTYIDEFKFKSKFPEFAKEVGDLNLLKVKSVRRSFYERITLKEMSEVTFDLDDILEECIIYDNQMNRINCTYLSPVVQWYSFEDKVKFE